MLAEESVDELTAVRELSSAFTSIRTALELIPKELETLQRSNEMGPLLFDYRGNLLGQELDDHCELPGDPDAEVYCRLIFEDSAAKYLMEYVVNLYESQREAEVALHGMPPRLIELLSSLVGRPWDMMVRRECLDWVIAWPGETLHPTAIASKKVPAKPQDVLKLASERPPFETWAAYGERLKSYGADLVSLRGRLKSSSPGQEFVTQQEISEQRDVRRVASEAEIPATHRYRGEPNGEPLTADVIGSPEKYGLTRTDISRGYKGPVLKIGKQYVYPHTDIAALSDRKRRDGDEK